MAICHEMKQGDVFFCELCGLDLDELWSLLSRIQLWTSVQQILYVVRIAFLKTYVLAE